MKVLVVQHDHVSPIGPVGEAFSARGYDVDELLVVDEEHFDSPGVTADFPEPERYDVIVPMGAPWSVYDHDRIGSWVADELTFLRRALAGGVPILGICFGGQLLAAALGGAVVPAERPELGWTIVRTSRPELVEPGPWFSWHGDRWELPADVEAFARTDVAEQAFAVGRAMGLQFHPELTPSMLAGWLANGGARHARDLGVDPDALLQETAERAEGAGHRARRLVNAFLDVVVAGPAGGRRG